MLNMLDENNRRYMQLLDGLFKRFGGILISIISIKERIEDLHNRPWFDESADRWTNKMMKKRHTVAVWGHEEFTKELLIIGLGKILEDTFNEIEAVAGCKIKFWANPFPHEVRNLKEAKIVRQLSNTIKHNSGIVDATHDGFSILKDAGFQAGDSIGKSSIDHLEYSLHIFNFLLDLIVDITKPDSRLLLTKILTKQSLVSLILPESLQRRNSG